MRLGLITEDWRPSIGGIENYLANAVAFLEKAGDEVAVVAPKGRGTRGEKKEKGQRVIRKRFYNPLVRPKWWLLYRWLKKKAKKDGWEVTLCGKALFAGIVGRRLKRALGIPYIVFTYAMEIEEWKKGWWQRVKLKKVLQEADKVICINEITKKSIIELGVAKEKIVKAWPGLSSPYYARVEEEEIRKVLAKYEIERPYVLSVGRLIARKGFDLLVEAFSKIDQTKHGDKKLVIVGDGPLLDELQASVEAEMIDNSVLFLPDVPDDDLLALYAGAYLFALTPRNVGGDMEGFGIVYLEAAGQGVPSVGTRVGGVPEAVIDGGTGILVEEGNVEGVVKAMERILSDRSFRDELGVRARRRAEEEFNWDNRGEIIREAVKSVRRKK